MRPIISPRAKELKKSSNRARKKKLIIFLSIFAILFIGSGFLSQISRLQIGGVTVNGTVVLDADAITHLVEKTISGKYLWLFPKQNIFLYPKSLVIANIAEGFRRAEDIKVMRTSDNTLVVSLKERAPAYLWCGEMPKDTVNNHDCYFVDNTGFIFDHAPAFSGQVYFIWYGKITNDKDTKPIGGRILDEEHFQSIVLMKDRFTALSFNLIQIILSENGDYEFGLSYMRSASAHPKVIFNKNANLGRVMEDFATALLKDPLKTKIREDYNKLLYLDLRFDNKVYYKFTE